MERAVVQIIFVATLQPSVVLDAHRIVTQRLSVDNMALPASKIVLWTCAVPSLGQLNPNLIFLADHRPIASVEVLLTFVTPAVKWVLADVVLLRNHLAAAPRSASVRSGQYR